MKKILALDGGGVRGWLMIALLAKLENLIQNLKHDPSLRIIDFFDIIAGTSAGGIIASLLTLHHRPTATDVQVYFETHVSKVFVSNSSILGWLWSWEKPKYSPANLINFTTEMIGMMRISEITKTLVLTTYDLNKQEMKMITNSTVVNPINRQPEDFNLADAVRATASAPTFFPPADIKSYSGNQYTLIDGGVAANNPALMATLFAGPLDSIFLLSLGAGDERTLYNVACLKNGGKLAWAMPLINILFTAGNDMVDMQCKEFLGRNLMNKYHRLNPPLKKTSNVLDDCSAINFKAMKDDLETWASTPEIEDLLGKIATELVK
jgi:patatin-like phospholipase/acyl hydrolase